MVETKTSPCRFFTLGEAVRLFCVAQNIRFRTSRASKEVEAGGELILVAVLPVFLVTLYVLSCW